MNNKNDLLYCDLLLQAENQLEKRLAGCLIFYPKETLTLCGELKPNVNIKAKNFWYKVLTKKQEILSGTQSEAIDICALFWINDFLKDNRTFFKFYFEIENDGPEKIIADTVSTLKQLRIQRITTKHIEMNQLFEIVYEDY